MAQAYSKYNTGINFICAAAVNFSTDAFILALSNTTPATTTSQYTVTNISEIGSSGGYTQGTGIPITTTSFLNSAGTSTWVGTAALFSATGAVPQFDFAILYDNTNTSKPLLGWWTCVTAITMASTDTFQVSWGSNQILQFT